MNTKNNQRFLRTQQRLEQEFLKLCQTTDSHKITVSQLCAAVGINRSTFYDHYLDIPDLIHQTGAKHLGRMLSLLRPEKGVGQFPLTSACLPQMLSYIREHQYFFDIYFHHTAPGTVSGSFSLLLEEICWPYLETFSLTEREALQYHLDFYKAGFIAVLSRWVRRGCIESPQQLTELLLMNLPVPKEGRCLPDEMPAAVLR